MILARCLYSELARKTGWITLLLVLIFASQKMIQLLKDTVSGSIPADIIFDLLWAEVVFAFPKILPATVMLGIWLTFRRMRQQRELTAMFAAGMGVSWQLQKTCRFVSVVFFILLLFIVWLTPMAGHHLKKLRLNAKEDFSISSVPVRDFYEFDQQRRILYVNELDAEKKTARGILIHTRKEEQSSISFAEVAYLQSKDGYSYVHMSQGNNYSYIPKQADYKITEFDTYAIRLEQNDNIEIDAIKASAMYFSDLWNSKQPAHLAERHWRYGTLLSCILLALFAVLVNQPTNSAKGVLQLILTLATYLSYSNLLIIGTSLLKRETIPVWLGLWWVHLLMTILLVIMYRFTRLGRRRGKVFQTT